MRRLLLLLCAATACRDAAEARDLVNRAPQADQYRAGMSDAGATHVRTIIGFNDPESVRYDPQQDVFFVSNTAGLGSARDANGYIVRISAARMDSADVFVRSGANGVTLHAPKGLALQGDTLWVTDIDVVRGFNRFTGQPVGTIDFSAFSPVQLNDIATGPDGMRVTDTGIHMVYEGNVHTGPDKVFAIDAGRRVRVVIQDSSLHLPNGITWDDATKRWIVVAFDRHAGEVWVLPSAGDTSRTVLRRGKGQLDGVEALPNGKLLFSSWADSAIHVLEGTRDTPIIRQVHEPADIGVDTRRGRVLIPLAVIGHVQVWDLGPAWTGRR
ncbi:MAG TPA: hypothetical protein VEB19_18400 [Gemmatimonadaceae bacterium]|nr:hypothetical protein [Gemmatimonadaceae bacterium]